MTIWVSSMALAPGLAQRHRPALIVSLLSPYDDFPEFRGHADDKRLRVPIHDIVAPVDNLSPPALSDMETVIGFLEGWDMSAPLLVHCFAGISRSTATAFVAACLHNPEADEGEIAQAIRAASPTASPNRLLVEYADALLGRNGRMSRAVDAIGRGLAAYEAEPFSIPGRYGVHKSRG